MACSQKKGSLVSDGKVELKNSKLNNVLYQRLGNEWYAFTLVNDELYFGLIPQDVLEGKVNGGQAPKAPTK